MNLHAVILMLISILFIGCGNKNKDLIFIDNPNDIEYHIDTIPNTDHAFTSFNSEGISFLDVSIPRGYLPQVDIETDWNFDGNSDITVLDYARSGNVNMLNNIWIYNEEERGFVYDSLLSDLSPRIEDSMIVSFWRFGGDSEVTSYYSWHQGVKIFRFPLSV